MRRASSNGMLKGYLAHRAACDETFLAFSRRHEVEGSEEDVRCGDGANDAKLASADHLARSGHRAVFREQRAWLNGFFAGLVSLDGSGVTPLSGDQAAALLLGNAGRHDRYR